MDKKKKKDKSKSKILFIGANNKKTLILMGLSNGFRIFDFKTLEEVRCKIFTGGIGKIDCLETSNFLCFTGGGNLKITKQFLIKYTKYSVY